MIFLAFQEPRQGGNQGKLSLCHCFFIEWQLFHASVYWPVQPNSCNKKQRKQQALLDLVPCRYSGGNNTIILLSSECCVVFWTGLKAAWALDHNNECCARCGFGQEQNLVLLQLVGCDRFILNVRSTKMPFAAIPWESVALLALLPGNSRARDILPCFCLFGARLSDTWRSTGTSLVKNSWRGRSASP